MDVGVLVPGVAQHQTVFLGVHAHPESSQTRKADISPLCINQYSSEESKSSWTSFLIWEPGLLSDYGVGIYA